MVIGRYVFLVLGLLVTSIVYYWAVATIPLAKRFRKVLVVLTALFVAMSTLRRPIMARLHIEHLGAVFVGIELFVYSLVVAAIPIGFMRLAFHFYRKRAARRAKGERPATPAPTAAEVSRRQLGEATLGSVILAGATGTLAFGAARGRFEFEVDELVVRIPGLPKGLEGYTIAQVSDLHGGAFISAEDLVRGFGFIAKIRPDLVVATGDLVDFDPHYAPMVARALADIRSRDGVVTILGNHDYYTGAANVTGAMERAGVTMLVNQGLRIRPKDHGGIALLGVDDAHGRRFGGPGPNLTEALLGIPEDVPRILLSHQPTTMDMFAGKVALQLSGHTHGGQINPGFTPAKLFLKYVRGRYEVGGTTLYVNRGFGTAGPPSRVNAPPEITKVVLVSA